MGVWNMRKRNMYNSVLALTLVLGVVSITQSMSWAADRALLDLEAVRVIVLLDSLSIEPSETLKARVTTDTELRLRMAGLDVYSIGDEPGGPFGRLITILQDIDLDDERHTYIYNVSMNFLRPVTLPWDTATAGRYWCVLWERETMGIVSKAEYRDKVRNTAKDLTDQFINDYLAANPKKQDKEP